MAFYGDDFTGSTDALEVLTFAGLRSALLLKPPTADVLARFSGLDAIGLAGDSRGMSPQEMDQRLPAVFDFLEATGAPIVHYKVCSTFDSSPAIGSIGHVIELARRQFPGRPFPVVAGNPALGRYCVFGHLFARSGTDGQVYRIDRHPIMSVHPVTPMNESDLSLHLQQQAELAIGKLTLADLQLGRAHLDATVDALTPGERDAVMLDANAPAHLTEIGRQLERWRGSDRKTTFVVGSSGVQYALTQWWKESGALEARDTNDFRFERVDQALAVSGSGSSLTALQIACAIRAGYADIAVNALQLMDEDQWRSAADKLVVRAVELLRAGHSVLLHTALGADDPRIGEMIDGLMQRGWDKARAKHEGGRLLGIRMGHVTAEILERAPVPRLLLSGGDTSSQVTQTLGPDALTVAAKLAPGAPLCRMVSSVAHLDGLEVALKGGQMGDESFFVAAKAGTA